MGNLTYEHADNLVWGTMFGDDNIVWGTSAENDLGNSGEDAPLFDDPITEPVNFDQTVFESLFSTPLVTASVPNRTRVLIRGRCWGDRFTECGSSRTKSEARCAPRPFFAGAT